MDPAELRRKNYLTEADMPYELQIPYRDGNPLVYDSGDFRAGLEAALTRGRLRRPCAPSRLACASRASTAASASRATSRAPRSDRTKAPPCGSTPSGHAVVATGACCQGQGHETSFAQIAADALGIPLDWVTVVGGDTAAIPFGVGTFASRSAVNAGSSIHEASGRVKDKIVAAAAALLEAAPADIEVSDGIVAVRGAPGSVTPLAAVIQAAHPDLRQARGGRARTSRPPSIITSRP